MDDTQRLDWMLAHPGADMDTAGAKARGGWRVVWFSESKYTVAYGTTPRECIDNAIAGKVEKW